MTKPETKEENNKDDLTKDEADFIDFVRRIAVKALWCIIWLVFMHFVFGLGVFLNQKNFLLNMADRDADGLIFDRSGVALLINGGWNGIGIKDGGGLIDIPFLGFILIGVFIVGLYSIITAGAPKPRRHRRS